MRLLVVCEQLNLGGAETRILTLCRGLLSLGCKPVIVSSGGILVQELRRLGLTHYVLDFRQDDLVMEHIQALRGIMAKEGIEVVHIHPYTPLLSGIMASWLSGLPFVITFHGPGGWTQANWGQFHGTGYAGELVEAALTRPGTAVIAASPEVKALLEKTANLPTGKITVIPNAVDSGVFLARPVAQVPRRFLVVARLDGDKIASVLNALSLFAYYHQQYDREALLRVAGDGREYKLVASAVDDLNRRLGAGTATMCGGQDLIHEAMAESDVIIGMGRVMIEAAMSLRIPVMSGYDGLKGLLETENCLRFAERNFSGRGEPSLTVPEIAEAIRRYERDKLNDLRALMLDAFDARIWTAREAAILAQVADERSLLRPDEPVARLARRLIEINGALVRARKRSFWRRIAEYLAALRAPAHHAPPSLSDVHTALPKPGQDDEAGESAT